MPEFDIDVKLIGEDGNVFNLIGKVKRQLERAGESEAARDFFKQAISSHSYDEVLQLITQKVNVV